MENREYLVRIYSDLAEVHDNVSEVARKEAERSKQKALRGLTEEIREKLVIALGEATNEKERMEAVGSVMGETFPETPNMDWPLLSQLRDDLTQLYVNETMRDTYRGLAEALR